MYVDVKSTSLSCIKMESQLLTLNTESFSALYLDFLIHISILVSILIYLPVSFTDPLTVVLDLVFQHHLFFPKTILEEPPLSGLYRS